MSVVILILEELFAGSSDFFFSGTAVSAEPQEREDAVKETVCL